jgi:hypothetical protein
LQLVLIASAVKLLAEIALMAMAGQFLLGLLAGAKRETNFFYKLLQIITNPVTRSARWPDDAYALSAARAGWRPAWCWTSTYPWWRFC